MSFEIKDTARPSQASYSSANVPVATDQRASWKGGVSLSEIFGSTAPKPDSVGTVEKLFSLLEALIEKLKELIESEQSATQTSSGAAGASVNAADSEAPSNEFLWKPVSDKDGKLAILLPSSMSDQASSVKIIGPDGRELATGEASGSGNGQRAHFRFNQPGSAFPNGSVVRIEGPGGVLQEIRISNTASRFTQSA